jgi:hypothetical protein
MWSPSIVEVEEAGEARNTRLGRGERFRVRPLLEQRPDEPFGLAIGLGPIRPGEPMTDAELVAGRREVVTSIAATVVGQDPLDGDPVARIEVPGSLEEARRGRRCFIGELLGVGEPAVVVDREVDPVPAQAVVWVAALPAVDPMTATRSDPTEHLRVEVDELAWSFALVTDDRWSWFEPVESSEAFAPEDRVHRAPGQACLPGEDVRTDAQLTPTNTQASDKIGRMPMGLVVDRAGAVDQDAGLGATPPLRPGLTADASRSGCCCDRPAGSDPIGQESPTMRGQSGIRMSHEGPFFDCGLQHQQPNDRGPQPVNNLIGN